LFNISGIIVFYPVKKLREIPINLANRLSNVAAERRSLALAYTLTAFVIVPLLGVVILR
jgi:sodium-dependent phosphate cotransporter